MQVGDGHIIFSWSPEFLESYKFDGPYTDIGSDDERWSAAYDRQYCLFRETT